MIELKSADTIRNQIEKARRVRPRVRFVRFRHYLVQGSEGAWYEVTFRYEAGRRLAHCTCPAGGHDRPCYHVAAAVAHHLVVAAEMRARTPQRSQVSQQQAEAEAVYVPYGRLKRTESVRGIDV